MEYRKLTAEEIAQLEKQNCRAQDWTFVTVREGFSPEYVHQATFSGNIRLGRFERVFTFEGGVRKQAGIYNATLHNCEIGDDVLIDNIQNYIANYKIGNNTLIRQADRILTDKKSTFGNGVEVAVLNETGGREVKINDKLSAHVAYILALYRHRPALIARLNEMIDFYSQKHASEIGEIGDNVQIINTGLIRNVRIGNNARMEGACRLENGSINSNEYDPVHIGYGVIAEDFIICSGSQVEDGTMLTRCFVGQSCQLGHAYSASDSLFFSNCQGENGEACAIFAGPYTVTHHKSTLLIAGMFSFMNAGSGSNQSNHMYKLGPIHQGIIERGGKTTSDSYILWPAKIGAFSLIMGRHYRNSDTSNMPFSYLIESNDESILAPGVNLKSVGTIRDAQKFPKRDRRKDPHKLDQINFNLLSPYTVQKMFKAIEILKGLQITCGETSESYTYQSCRIKNSSLKKGLDIYDKAIKKFLGNSIISRLEGEHFTSIKDVRKRLQPDSDAGLGVWHDMAGVLMPKQAVDELLDGIESGAIHKLKDINSFIQNAHKNYYSYEWTWAWDKIRSYYKVAPETITADDIIRIVEDWKEAVVEMDKVLYEDAKKEFSLSSRTGFGIDGNDDERRLDFEYVRGNFEKNTFVASLLQHIEKKTHLGNKIIDGMKRIATLSKAG
jgi:carbonic anhydrase/acetyltransferase-like protein (isoleucine patch superfamily)